MSDRSVPRIVAEAANRALPLRIRGRVRVELTPEFVALCRVGRQAEAVAFWEAGVRRISDEELDAVRAELAKYEVEGSA